ncbi:hypothetical protein [Luteimonas deserti]|uniref:Uncharacterized protein n=1 Tax=Luteimonas deserti TaxID=2752306 RepID=A0A7Z0TXQ0_9GAMM|nr:hypothetical protein [Luteimonas deserti]NYZ62030.1 hypothetical protein [Luteimonas deserti]
MGKQSDAKRKAKLKERRKIRDAAIARSGSSREAIAKWMAAQEGEPNINAELVDEHGAVLARLEGDSEELWTVYVGDDPIAGSHDEFIALGFLLTAAVDEHALGRTCFLQFYPWLLEEIERRCAESEMEWQKLLSDLLPPDRQHLALPPHQMP